MNKQIHKLIIIISAIFLSISVSYAQCEPDTVNCKDTLQPGEFCPRILPDGYLGTPYNEVITIIPPGFYNYLNTEVTVVKIVVTDVQNLPPGITHVANAEEFFPDTAYCVLLSGTPETAGIYDLGITVTATVDVPNIGIIGIEDITDDTSVSITIQVGSGLEDQAWQDQFVKTGPNPFRHTTQIRMNASTIENAELLVYNLLGGIVYREQIRTSPGINSFTFNGQDLRHGTYIYHVSTSKKIYTNRLLKLQD